MARAAIWARTLQPIPTSQHLFRALTEVRKRAWRPILPALVRHWRADAAQLVALVRPARLARLARALQTALGPRAAEVGELVLAGRPVGRVEALDWQLTGLSPLQVYEAHYLEWTVDLAASDEARLDVALSRWQRASVASRQAWEPYPRARRVLATLRAAALVQRPTLRTKLLIEAAAAWLGLDWLVERHLDGNHLLLDRVAAAAGEALFERGTVRMARLFDELARQFDREGGHCEASPMYHAVACEDLLTLETLLRDGPERQLLGIELKRYVAWLRAARHADGTLPGFGDSDALALDALPLSRADLQLPIPVAPRLDGLGSLWSCAAPDERLVVHTAPPVWQPQPGHAHDDTFAVEWSWAGRRWLADAGLSGYDGDPHRALCRSNECHSTVAVAGNPALELWGSFRVGRRGQVRPVRRGTADGWRWMHGMHLWPAEPFARQTLVHHRLVGWRPGALWVCDRVTLKPSEAAVRAQQRWVLAPGVELNDGPQGFVQLQSGDSRLYATATRDFQVGLSPRFALRQRTADGPCLAVDVDEVGVWAGFAAESAELTAVPAALQTLWLAT